MTENEPQFSDPTPIDPRLKSFMRQATAVITAEKGLNATSRIKLETLAKRLKLPQDLFDEALLLLQSNEALNLTHFEKAFVKFLDFELSKIKGGVISLGMELEAIGLADRKYQINSTRAEQLIEARAKAADISRISPAEAGVFAERIIVERTNKLAVVDDELREDLYRIGKKWGYRREQVDRVIFREISQNRAQKRSALLKRAATLLALILLAGAGAAIATGHIPTNFFASSQPKEPVTDAGQPDQTKEDQPKQLSTYSGLQKFAQANNAFTILRQASEAIGQNDALQRKAGFEQLSELVCTEPRFENTELPELTTQLYYEEQSDVAALGVLSAIERRLQIQSPTHGISVDELKNNYRANQLLAQLCYSKIARVSGSESRRNSAAGIVGDLIRIPVSKDQTFLDYLSRSESAIAVDHWSLLNQTIWSPSSNDAAVLYGPILSLTKTKLDAETLNSYSDESLISLIEVDGSDWEHLEEPIRETISRCNEVKLNRWISAFVKSDNTSMQDFLAPLLLKRTGVKPKSVVRKDVYQAIENYEMAVRDRLIEPVTSRNANLTQQLEIFLREQPTKLEEVTADHIANVALRVNLQMAFCAALEDVSHVDEASFVQFDRLNQTASSGPFRLRELVSLPIDRGAGQATRSSSATASDKARKKEAIARLSLLGKDTTGLRKLALSQLAKVAPRFARLSYQESRTLAAYLLSNLETEELLNVQLQIEAFAHWPNLALAISDKLPESSVELDQALTISRLLLGRDLDVQQQDNWKQSLQSNLYGVIADQVSNQVDLDPDNTRSNWNRLRIYLNDAYSERLKIAKRRSFLNQNFSTIDQSLLELSFAFADLQNFTHNPTLKNSRTIVERASANEIARTVLAGQFLVQVVLSEFDSTEFADTAQGLVSQFQSKITEGGLVGEQLFQTELVLLRLFSLKQQLLVTQLRERS